VNDGNLKNGHDIEVEWYSGREVYTYPKRVKVDGVWEEVFSYEKSVREHSVTKKREVVFRCHIGDNRIIEIASPNDTI
jgi:hypothetical protein